MWRSLITILTIQHDDGTWHGVRCNLASWERWFDDRGNFKGSGLNRLLASSKAELPMLGVESVHVHPPSYALVPLSIVALQYCSSSVGTRSEAVEFCYDYYKNNILHARFFEHSRLASAHTHIHGSVLNWCWVFSHQASWRPWSHRPVSTLSEITSSYYFHANGSGC
jgi:hypothetical protein